MIRVFSPCHRLRAAVLLGGLLAVMIVGCGGNTGPKLVPVSGKVFSGTSPLGVGLVTFHPDAAKGNNAKGVSTGMIQSDGTYKLVTGDKEGAPLGWYKVAVSPMGMPTDMTKGTPPPAKVPAKYTKPETSGLNVEVVASPASGSYDLRLGD